MLTNLREISFDADSEDSEDNFASRDRVITKEESEIWVTGTVLANVYHIYSRYRRTISLKYAQDSTPFCSSWLVGPVGDNDTQMQVDCTGGDNLAHRARPTSTE